MEYTFDVNYNIPKLVKCYLVKITFLDYTNYFLISIWKDDCKPVSGSRHPGSPVHGDCLVRVSTGWPSAVFFSFYFFWTYGLFDAQITGNGIRSRSSRNVFVMPVDAYLYRIYGFITTERNFEIKLPPRTDQYQERKRARKIVWKGEG